MWIVERSKASMRSSSLIAVATMSSISPPATEAYARIGSVAGRPVTCSIRLASGPEPVYFMPLKPSSSHGWAAPGEPDRRGEVGAESPSGVSSFASADRRDTVSRAPRNRTSFVTQTSSPTTSRAETARATGFGTRTTRLRSLLSRNHTRCSPMSIRTTRTAARTPAAVASTSSSRVGGSIETSLAVSTCARWLVTHA